MTKSTAPQAPAAPVASEEVPIVWMERTVKVRIPYPFWLTFRATGEIIEGMNVFEVYAESGPITAPAVGAPPAPTLEGIEALVKKWRNSFSARPSTEDYYRKDYNDAAHSDDIAKTIRDMADELEAELRHITPMQAKK